MGGPKSGPSPPGAGREGKKKKVGFPTPPLTSAVVLTVERGSGKDYEEVLRTAKARISLEGDVDVPSLGIRRTRTGGLIF